MTLDNIMNKLFGFTRASYYNWLREGRIIIMFINNYFDRADIEEIITNNGRLVRLEVTKHIPLDKLKEQTDFIRVQHQIDSLIGKLKFIEDKTILLYLLGILNERGIENRLKLNKFLKLPILPKTFVESMNLLVEELSLAPDCFKMNNRAISELNAKFAFIFSEYFVDSDVDFILDYRFFFLNEIKEILRKRG